MGVVIGRGARFYDIPEDVLAKYEMPEEKTEKIREKMKGVKVKLDEEVEGYGLNDMKTLDDFLYELFGWSWGMSNSGSFH